MIAESMYAQCDTEGNKYLLMDSITDYESDNSIDVVPMTFISPTTSNGQRKMRKTTKGWRFCVLWKDGSTSWEHLKDLKESKPVHIAEFTVANKLVSEPAFIWWVPFTLKKRDQIIAKVNTRYLKHTHKFGIKMPKTTPEAFRPLLASNSL
jgi:hypothetical protein